MVILITRAKSPVRRPSDETDTRHRTHESPTSDDFEDGARTAFTERFGADADEAAAFREEVAEESTVEALVGALSTADDYETFAHRYGAE